MLIVHVYHVYDYIISAQISVTFDPFMSLSVPIPRNLRHLPVIFVPQDPNIMPIEVGGCAVKAHFYLYYQFPPSFHGLITCTASGGKLGGAWELK